jgi:hypothetical protein
VHRFVALFAFAAAVAAQPPAPPELYVLPMRAGLDQFLANHIAASQLYRVATDPKRATLFLTDRLGEPFEQKMQELFPAPKAPEESDAAASSAKEHDFPRGVFLSGTAKGNVFLVDAQSRQVLWSAYVKPKNTTPDELNRTARRIVERLLANQRGK